MAAEEGSRGHQQGTAASNDNGSAPPATDSSTLSQPAPGENSNNNSGSMTAIPVAKDAGKVQDDVVEGHGSAGSGTHSAGQSKRKRSPEEVAAATDDTDDNTSEEGKLQHSGADQPKRKRAAAEVAAAAADDNVSKARGEVKIEARDGNRGAGGKRKQQLLPHVVTERERRKRMKGMYAELQALLPHVPEKTDKATIVGEAVSFIRLLQGTVVKLEKRKRDLALARRAAAAAVIDLESASSVAAAAAPPLHAALVGSSSSSSSPSDLPQGWAWLPKQPKKKPPPVAAPVGFQTWSGTNVVLSVSRDDAFINVCAPRRAGVMVLVLSVLEKHRIDVLTVQVASDGGRCMFTIHARVNTAAVLKLGSETPASEDIYKLAVSEIMVWLSN